MNIEAVRLYCLSQPHATEDMPFGEDYVAFRIAGKIFAGLALGQGNVLQLKCHPDEFDEVTAQYPFVTQAWHWHKRHWIQLELDDAIDDAVIQKLIDRAYAVVWGKLTRKQRMGISPSR